jgi:hypothetical protein
LAQSEAIILFVLSLSGAKHMAEWVQSLLVHLVLHNAHSGVLKITNIQLG